MISNRIYIFFFVMPISQTDHVFNLVKSLTPAEKRHFRQYVSRVQSSDGKLFMKLFDILDKQKKIEDGLVLKSLGSVSKTQYSNLKRHLYTQIITSLRLIHKIKRSNIQVRELLDYAYILYGKGLYLQALKVLSQAKKKALKHHLNLLALTIVEFEKTIESRHITRSQKNRDKDLILDATVINKRISRAVDLSNLKVRLHGKYIRYGHVKNDFEEAEVKNFFIEATTGIRVDQLSPIEKVYFYQSQVWYHYIMLDFQHCFDNALQWINLLKSNNELLWRDVDLLMRGYHYLLTSAFNLKDREALERYLDEFERFRKKYYARLNLNSQIISFLYVHTSRLNRIILSGQFGRGEIFIPKTIRRINRYAKKLDSHRILILYYKFAWIFLGSGKVGEAIEYLNYIVNQSFKNLREDIQSYAKILFLLCHYELKNYNTVLYLIRRFEPAYKTASSLNVFQLKILFYLRQLSNKPESEHPALYGLFYDEMTELSKEKYSKRAFIYLDIQTWILAKIERKPLGDIISQQKKKTH